MSKNNTVSPETALRLKAAGFPQPEIEPGQVWHGRGKTVQILGHNIENNYVEYITDSRRETIDSFTSFSELFAYYPTIPDLLATLGEITIRRIEKPSISGYAVYKRTEIGDTEITSDDDLAEALALMWEKLNKQ